MLSDSAMHPAAPGKPAPAKPPADPARPRDVEAPIASLGEALHASWRPETASIGDIDSVLCDVEAQYTAIVSAAAAVRIPGDRIRWVRPGDRDYAATPLALSLQSEKAKGSHLALLDAWDQGIGVEDEESGSAEPSVGGHERALAAIRTLPVLRAEAWPWLMAVIRRAERAIARGVDQGLDEDDPVMQQWDENTTRVSHLVANLSGPASAGDLDRQWQFDHLRITTHETSLAAADLGGTSWGAGIVLASLIDRQLLAIPDAATSILELGSGTGLGGLAASMQYLGRTVTLTDYHPGVLATLGANAALNGCTNVVLRQLDWRWFIEPEVPADAATPVLPRAELVAAFHAPDVLIAADVVYETRSVEYLAATLAAVAAKRVYIVLPMRPRYHGDVTLFETHVAPRFCPHQRVIEYRGAYYKLYASHGEMGA
ncbi:hypothetical protein H9P43_000349 [Blastocladiella emersonii ATCC 22665]|nr:hypothetical protein H9P43_000349 [Blastocladiella emersonii ATCC 22665]